MKPVSVSVFILLGLIASITLNYFAKAGTEGVWLLVGYGLVYVLHAVRFMFWGAVLKKFDLSSVYPLTGLFFPLIYMYSVFNGEAQLETSKLIGVGLILLGVFLIETKAQNE